jgi:hypothetical protein
MDTNYSVINVEGFSINSNMEVTNTNNLSNKN